MMLATARFAFTCAHNELGFRTSTVFRADKTNAVLPHQNHVETSDVALG